MEVVVREGRNFRVKQYGIWISLLARRLWRQPVYIVLLVLIPLLGYGAGFMERGEQSGVAVAVCVEDGVWKEKIMDMLAEQEADSVLQFVYLDGSREVERCVAAEEAACGFVIGQDIAKKVLDGAWRKSITVFETDSGSVTGIAEERLAGVIFRLYAEEYYDRYMGRISETAAAFAREAYERRLVDDSTFSFQYIYDDSTGQFSYDTPVVDDINVNKDVAAPVFPVKGILAVLIFLGGLCGMLEYERDKKEKRFVRMAPDLLTYLVNVWISTVFLSAAVLVCRWGYDGMRCCGAGFSIAGMLRVWSAGMWGRQIMDLVVYQCIIMAYCVILKLLLRRQETIAAAIPILTLGSLVCAPVFVRLGTYMPVFTVLEKLFPVTYYLM